MNNIIEDADFLLEFDQNAKFSIDESAYEIDKDQLLKIDKESFILNKLNDKKLERKNKTAFQEFIEKSEKLENITYKKYLEFLSSSYESKDNFLAFYYNNYKPFKLKPPSNYPYCDFEAGKREIAISKINERLRLGGHLHKKEFILYLFWIENDINQIYNNHIK